MMDCIPNEQHACINCGWKWNRQGPFPHRCCPQSPDLQPAAEKLGVSLADVGHYASALARWTAAGFPIRDQAEVERIESEFCKPCPKYTVDPLLGGRCSECGCRVSASRFAAVNKIKMATERCPKGKW
jgi:hypothetical protein